MANVLIIDDDPLVCELLQATMQDKGHTGDTALSAQTGLEKASSFPYDVVYLDVRLPDRDGIEVLETLKHMDNPPEVIIITGRGDPDGAELAMRNGAWDYIEKPGSIDRMTMPLDRALKYRKAKRTPPHAVLDRGDIAGSSVALSMALQSAANAAASSAEVLITGETGTGKELIARAIHNNSSRRDNPFIVVDCAALPDNLVESLLFGHVKGAFTSATASHKGLVAEAHNGTLFLDEVGELPPLVQAKFLRVLQEHSFRPVGAGQEIHSKFRLVAATNRNLTGMAESGTFRSDLLFRLRTLQVDVPPLRKRLQDIPELVQSALRRISKRYDSPIKGIAPDFHATLENYSWPGNVRELFSALETAFLAASAEPILYPHHLPLDIRACAARQTVKQSPPEAPPIQDSPGPWKEYKKKEMHRIEGSYFRELLCHCNGDKQKACDLSGLKPARLYELLSKHKIK